MNKLHNYKATINWTGNSGTGTSSYQSYSRNHTVQVEGKAEILCSSDPAFSGDPARYNPEEMLLASLSSCHMLWYLHLCSAAGIVVVSYTDNATGIMEETADGSGKFTVVTLNPNVTITNNSDKNTAEYLHEKANRLCFIANSVNFTVAHNVTIIIEA
jgi:organic hydroperoxide reductase OsmC/OhrA